MSDERQSIVNSFRAAAPAFTRRMDIAMGAARRGAKKTANAAISAAPLGCAAFVGYYAGPTWMAIAGGLYSAWRFVCEKNQLRESVWQRKPLPKTKRWAAGMAGSAVLFLAAIDRPNLALLRAINESDYRAAQLVTRNHPRAEVCTNFSRPDEIGWGQRAAQACTDLEGRRFSAMCFSGYRVLRLTGPDKNGTRETMLQPITTCRDSFEAAPSSIIAGLQAQYDSMIRTNLMTHQAAPDVTPMFPQLAITRFDQLRLGR